MLFNGISNDLQKIIDSDQLVVLMDFGSRVYGTALETSDTDIKGLFVPTAKDILLSRAATDYQSSTSNASLRNSTDDVDVGLFSVQRFMELLTQGQTVALDMLFTPANQIRIKSDVWTFITDNKQQLLSRKCKAAIGYARSQANKYSLRGYRMKALESVLEALEPEYHSQPRMALQDSSALQRIISNALKLDSQVYKHITFDKRIDFNSADCVIDYLDVCGKKTSFTASIKVAYELFKKTLDGYGERAQAAKLGGADWKAMYHALRIAEQTIELLETGNITFPRPEAPYLLQVRKGERKVEEVSEKVEEGILRIEHSQETSTLPYEPNISFIEDCICSLHKKIINNEK